MRERISNKMMEKENFNVVDIFGENVFNDSVMQARLPKKVYKKLHEVMEEGKDDASGSPLINSFPEKLIKTLPFTKESLQKTSRSNGGRKRIRPRDRRCRCS